MLIIILVIQSLWQPFETKQHNVIATISFCSLLLINTITIRINSIISTHSFITQKATRLQVAHVVILYTPLMIGLGWGVKTLYERFCAKKFFTLKTKNAIFNCHCRCHLQRSYSEISLTFDWKFENTDNYGTVEKHWHSWHFLFQFMYFKLLFAIIAYVSVVINILSSKHSFIITAIFTVVCYYYMYIVVKLVLLKSKNRKNTKRIIIIYYY